METYRDLLRNKDKSVTSSSSSIIDRSASRMINSVHDVPGRIHRCIEDRGRHSEGSTTEYVATTLKEE